MRYLALGDSFTIGTGTTPDRAFPAVLVRLWGEAGQAWELSANDLVRALRESGDAGGPAEARYRAQLRAIHERIRADAPKARRYALPQPDWSLSPAAAAFGAPPRIAAAIERFNAVACEEAARAGAGFIDLFPLMRDEARRGMLAPDGLHPLADSYAEWAAFLRDLLV